MQGTGVGKRAERKARWEQFIIQRLPAEEFSPRPLSDLSGSYSAGKELKGIAATQCQSHGENPREDRREIQGSQARSREMIFIV